MGWDKLKLNHKYASFIKDSLNSTYVVAEGAWRAGKSIAILTAHIMYLDDLNVEGLHIVAGESISTVKTIFLDNPTGFSYKEFFAERAVEKQYEGKDSLQITNSRGKKQVLIFVGSSKSNSWKSIRGLTALSFVVTEANIAHQKFLQEGIGRTWASEERYRKIIMDLNPKNEKDPFYLEFLNVWQQQHKEGRFKLTYEHFTFKDNPGLEPKEKESILNEYDPKSLIYRAYILGERVTQAENIFILNRDNIISNPPVPTQYVIIVDPGVSASSTVFITMGITDNKEIIIYDNWNHKNGTGMKQLNVKQYPEYAADLAQYTMDMNKKFGFFPKYVLLDNDISFYRDAKTAFTSKGLGGGLLKYATKDKIDDRLRTMSSLLYKRKLLIEENQSDVIWAIESAEYDEKELEKSGKLVRKDEPKAKREELNFCDFLDPTDYGISYFIKYIK